MCEKNLSAARKIAAVTLVFARFVAVWLSYGGNYCARGDGGAVAQDPKVLSMASSKFGTFEAIWRQNKVWYLSCLTLRSVLKTEKMFSFLQTFYSVCTSDSHPNQTVKNGIQQVWWSQTEFLNRPILRKKSKFCYISTIYFVQGNLVKYIKGC